MGGLVRALKCATWRAGRAVGITFLLSVGFIFYFMILEGAHFTVEAVIGRFPQMLTFVGSFMFLAYSMLDTVIYVQYAMGCGCTRKNIFITSIYMHVFEIAASELMLVLYFALFTKGVPAGGSDVYKVVLILFTFVAGLSLTMGILVKRFGRIAYIGMIFFCAVIGGIAGGIMGYFGGGKFTDMLPEISVFAPAAVSIWYVVLAIIFWMNIRKMEVRV